MATLAEARGACRAVMFDDQLEAVESLIRAILRDPEGPGLPIVTPAAAEGEPHTGVHTQGATEHDDLEGQREDPRLHPNFGVTPWLVESMEVDVVTEAPGPSDYERGWRAGRGAAIHTIEDLRSQAPVHSPTEATLSVALDRVASLEVKVEP